MLSAPRVSISFSAAEWKAWARERGWDKPTTTPAVIQRPEPIDWLRESDIRKQEKFWAERV